MRYFFIWEPKKVTIKGAPTQKVVLDLHPSNKKGGRTFTTKKEFYLCKEDLKKVKEHHVYRLMDCLNFIKKGKLEFHSRDYKTYKEQGQGIMHWLAGKTVKVHVMMPDATMLKGIGEETLKKVAVGTVVQLERFGFCRLVTKKPVLTFWYGHR